MNVATPVGPAEFFMPSMAPTPTRLRPAALAGQVQLLPIDRITPHPDQPRLDVDESDPELQALAQSLADHRLLQPIAVVRDGPAANERYVCCAGHRRMTAARVAGWTVIPAFVLDIGEREARLLLVDENLQRKDLNPIEKAMAIALLQRPVADGGCGLKQVEVAQRFGKEKSWPAQMIRLLRLPPAWQERIARGEMHQRCGKALATYADRPDVLAAIDRDMAANPDDWEKAADFDRNLARIVEALDRLASLAGIEPDPADVRPLVRRAAPVDHGSPAPVGQPPAPAPERPQDRSAGEMAQEPDSAPIVDEGSNGEPEFRGGPPDVAPVLTDDGRERLLRQVLTVALELDLQGIDRLQECLANRRRQLVDLALPKRASKPRRAG